MLSMKKLPYHSGITMRIYPSNKQKHIIAINSGAFRSVYNLHVQNNREAWELGKYVGVFPWLQERIDYLNSTLNDTSGIRCALPYLNLPEIDGVMIANARQNYKKAWNNYRKNPHTVKPPTFHKKGYDFSYQTNAVYSAEAVSGLFDGSARFLDEKHVQLPIIGRIRIKGSDSRIFDVLTRTALTRIGTVTVGCYATGEYYVSMQLASSEPFVLPGVKTGSLLGIDVNVENYYTDSNGIMVNNPKYYKKSEAKLAKAQKKLSHKFQSAKKGKRDIHTASNYQKQRLKVAKIGKHIARQRAQFAHIQSKNIVNNHDVIVVEDLKIRNMLKNHHLAQAIADTSWYKLFCDIEYKAQQQGKTFIKVPPNYTTQTCSSCGYVLEGDKKLTLKDREWICPKCNKHHIRDHNAAINILNKGVATFTA